MDSALPTASHEPLAPAAVISRPTLATRRHAIESCSGHCFPQQFLHPGPRKLKQIVKRSTDVILSAIGLLVFGWIIAICWIIAAIETRSNGFFLQERIGRHGRKFRIIKIKTMHNADKGGRSTVTTSNSSDITRSGRVFRRFKLDELPQLINVLRGEMSFVGPRPDVAGFADRLQGEDRIILSLRPGITGPASIAFRDEADILAQASDPDAYNAQVIWPKKVAMNREYARNFGFWTDMKLILKTLL